MARTQSLVSSCACLAGGSSLILKSKTHQCLLARLNLPLKLIDGLKKRLPSSLPRRSLPTAKPRRSLPTAKPRRSLPTAKPRRRLTVPRRSRSSLPTRRQCHFLALSLVMDKRRHLVLSGRSSR